MARKKATPWKPPYERYEVTFHTLDWIEDLTLRSGPISAIGVVKVLLDFTNEREFIKQNTDIILSRYENTPYVCVEVYNGEK